MQVLQGGNLYRSHGALSTTAHEDRRWNQLPTGPNLSKGPTGGGSSLIPRCILSIKDHLALNQIGPRGFGVRKGVRDPSIFVPHARMECVAVSAMGEGSEEEECLNKKQTALLYGIVSYK